MFYVRTLGEKRIRISLCESKDHSCGRSGACGSWRSFCAAARQGQSDNDIPAYLYKLNKKYHEYEVPEARGS